MFDTVDSRMQWTRVRLVHGKSPRSSLINACKAARFLRDLHSAELVEDVFVRRSGFSTTEHSVWKVHFHTATLAKINMRGLLPAVSKLQHSSPRKVKSPSFKFNLRRWIHHV